MDILVHSCPLKLLFCIIVPPSLCLAALLLQLWPPCSRLPVFIHRCVFLFSRSSVPPHIPSRGLSRLLTFLWPSSYYVGTIRFILTRFTGVTLTTLLSACVCVCVYVRLCFMDLTSLRVNDVWKQTEEFRPLKFPYS